MRIRLYHVDAFATEYFKGNSAGVAVLENGDIEDRLKQDLAAELKHSETAFVLVEGGRFRLRWFTPTMEVDLCGHATLAAAHVLYAIGQVPEHRSIVFETKSGPLTIRKANGRISMDFPVIHTTVSLDAQHYSDLLGIKLNSISANDKRFLAELRDPAELRNYQPNLELLKSNGIKALMITSRSDDPRYDFISRFFAPGFGIDEDPVTGSAHCYLAPYWEERLGKKKFLAFQASKRSGEVECELIGNSRVLLGGNATILYETEVNLD